jgi:hypothetical protein
LENKSLFLIIEPCCNELIYLQNQIPQFLKVADKIILVDDYSTDGTKEWVEGLNEPRIEFYQNTFECCAQQFDYALQKAPKGNVWIYNVTPVELPTDYFFDNIRDVLDDADRNEVDRIWMTVFHLRGERDICQEIGGELRLYKNRPESNCRYAGYPHECIEGQFEGHCVPEVDKQFAFVRFRQADKKKIEEWLTKYVEKGLYSLWDLNRRLNYPTTSLPIFIRYRINDELRRYLNWT